MPTTTRPALAELPPNASVPKPHLVGLAASIHAPRKISKSHPRPARPRSRLMSSEIPSTSKQALPKDLSNLTPSETRARRRAWNHGPLTDLFPLIPATPLNRILDILIDDKNFVYNLSQSALWNARRLTSIVVAHVRHNYTDYDRLLREERVERYEARRRTGEAVWKVLREWCPWEESNVVLRRAWEVTLVPREERDGVWDPMDIDEESDVEEGPATGGEAVGVVVDDPMDLD